jgi:two-component system, chemotaxis family, protein-glutamate methylesterase/glutaminase
MNILVVDDIVTIVSLLRTTLGSKGHTVVTARDGKQAEEAFKKTHFDIVLTDWLMPELDGIGLIHWIRANIRPVPVIIMITSVESPEARVKVLEAGADAYLNKPIKPQQISEVISQIEQKKFQRVTLNITDKIAVKRRSKDLGYAGVGIVAGTSGAAIIRTLFKKLEQPERASYFIVLHGPGWASEALADQIQMELPLPVVIPGDGEKIERGRIYVAPGDKHMIIDAEKAVIRLEATPPENFLRPSADPLFRSLASTFGARAIGVVYGGAGCDGSVGCSHVKIGEGTVIVQDPASSVSPQMPQNVITLGLAQHVMHADKIPGELSHRI